MKNVGGLRFSTGAIFGLTLVVASGCGGSREGARPGTNTSRAGAPGGVLLDAGAGV
jgi:hypothetical protein